MDERLTISISRYICIDLFRFIASADGSNVSCASNRPVTRRNYNFNGVTKARAHFRCNGRALRSPARNSRNNPRKPGRIQRRSAGPIERARFCLLGTFRKYSSRRCSHNIRRYLITTGRGINRSIVRSIYINYVSTCRRRYYCRALLLLLLLTAGK